MTTTPRIARHCRWSATPLVGHRLAAVKPPAFDRPAPPGTRTRLRPTRPFRRGARRSFPPARDAKSQEHKRSLPLNSMKTIRVRYVRGFVFLAILIIIAIIAS